MAKNTGLKPVGNFSWDSSLGKWVRNESSGAGGTGGMHVIIIDEEGNQIFEFGQDTYVTSGTVKTQNVSSTSMEQIMRDSLKELRKINLQLSEITDNDIQDTEVNNA